MSLPAHWGHVTAAELQAAGWDLRKDIDDGRIYAARDTRGAGMCYLTPPNPGQPWGSRFCEWVHPSWLSPTEFSALPRLNPLEVACLAR